MPNSRDTTSSCLHLVVGAGAQALDDCLRHLAADDAVVLLDCGVLHLLRSASTGYFASPVSVRYAAADLAAHGLAETARRCGAEVVDDAGICRLLAKHRHCLTWT